MKRLTYIPGIWSLGLLLPLCIWYLYRLGVWEQEQCITMTFPVPAAYKDMYPFPTPRELRHDWTEFACSGRPDDIQKTLALFSDSLRDLESRGDTTLGIHVHFGPDTKYATIISAIDICRMTVRVWELDDHDLWTLHYPEPKPVKHHLAEEQPSWECTNTYLGNCVVPLKQPDIERLGASLDQTWTGAIKPYWISWALLLLMGVAAVRSSTRLTF